MVEFLIELLLVARSRLKSRARLGAEILVLRHQVIVLSRNSPSRVRLKNIDRLIFVWLYRLFPSILNALTAIKPAGRLSFDVPTLPLFVHELLTKGIIESSCSAGTLELPETNSG